jgi:hypothetical protein
MVAGEPVGHRVEEPSVLSGDLIPGGRFRHDNERPAAMVPTRGRSVL